MPFGKIVGKSTKDNDEKCFPCRKKAPWGCCESYDPLIVIPAANKYTHHIDALLCQFDIMH